MANSISSDITISTAISVLGDLLAPLNQFTLNITNEIVGRQASVKVPIIGTDDVARDYAYASGYNSNADTDVTTITVPLTERIKPFHLVDNDMNKSPLTLQSYAKQNAHEFGRYLMNLFYTELDTAVAATAASKTAKNAGSVATADIKTIAEKLDGAGAPSDRHLILGAAANSNVMPTSIETFGANVLQSGRFGQLYGMQTHVSTANNDAVGKVHTVGASSDAVVIANRQPDVSGSSTLEEYTPFTIDGLGLQCAYRRYYDAAKGEHFGAFTTIFGVKTAKVAHLHALTRAS